VSERRSGCSIHSLFCTYISVAVSQKLRVAPMVVRCVALLRGFPLVYCSARCVRLAVCKRRRSRTFASKESNNRTGTKRPRGKGALHLDLVGWSETGIDIQTREI